MRSKDEYAKMSQAAANAAIKATDRESKARLQKAARYARTMAKIAAKREADPASGKIKL